MVACLMHVLHVVGLGEEEGGRGRRRGEEEGEEEEVEEVEKRSG